MTTNPFQPAKRSQSKLRFALMGASGSGKSYTALKIASGLGGKIAAIDTERGSLSKYAGLGVEFDVLELTDYHPSKYIAAIHAAVANGYDVLLIDSLSHAWSGSGGILEQVDRAAKKSQSQNSFAAWRDVTPIHNQLIETILGANVHIIVTMRSKTEYVLEKDERSGRSVPRKVGLAPVQRDGMEYEFDVVAEMDADNTLMVSKSRCIPLNGAVVNKPDAALGEQLKAWLSDGVAPAPTPTPQTTTPLPPAAHVRPNTEVWTHDPAQVTAPVNEKVEHRLDVDENGEPIIAVAGVEGNTVTLIHADGSEQKFEIGQSASPEPVTTPDPLEDCGIEGSELTEAQKFDAVRTGEPEQPAPQHLGDLKTLVVGKHKWVKGGQTHWDRLMSLLQGESKTFEKALLEDDFATMYLEIKAHYEAKEALQEAS